MNTLATYQLSGLAAEAAASRGRAANQGICAYPWPGSGTKDVNAMFVDLEVITTSKHRLRRPEDRSH